MERCIERRHIIHPILIDEANYDDEWIMEEEEPILSEEPDWLYDNDEDVDDDFLRVDGIRRVSINELYKRTTAVESDLAVSQVGSESIKRNLSKKLASSSK